MDFNAMTCGDSGEVAKLAGIGGGDENVLHISNFSQPGRSTLDTLDAS
jgi:hypothetical protein